MEEKLYSKPANYGKGKKKIKQEEQKEKDHKGLKLGLAFLVLAALVIVILYFLRGNTSITNEKIPNVKNTLVSCYSGSIYYPVFTYDGAEKRETDIKIVAQDYELKSISLEHSLFYNSATAIEASEAHNHAAMNLSFGKNGLGPDSYDAKYTILSDRVRMNLYAASAKLNDVAKQYFLVETEGAFPTSVLSLRKNYEAQGFTCETSD